MADEGLFTVCADTEMLTAVATPVDNAHMIVPSSRDKSTPIETTTKISDLPVNLVEEILARVPLKSIRSVRLTCKQWDTLSHNRSFSKIHIGKLGEAKEGESIMVAVMDYNLYLMKMVLINNEDPLIECKGKLACCQDQQIKISQVFHCDGLLLCVLEEEEGGADDTKVIVWNPYLCQTRLIECLYHHPLNRFSYALGYYEDKGGSRSYKFLRFIDEYYYDGQIINNVIKYEIYDFDSSSWKTLDVNPPHWATLYGQLGASLKGNSYWPASQRNTEEDEVDDHIVSFDFTSESFGPLLRLPFDAGRHHCVSLSSVRDEKLVVLLTYNHPGPQEFEIWISTKIEAGEVLWSKFLRVVETELDPMLALESFFVDEEKKVAMAFERDYTTFNVFGEDGYLKKLELVEGLVRDGKCRANGCSYVPGLVQIKKPASGRKRKQQNRL